VAAPFMSENCPVDTPGDFSSQFEIWLAYCYVRPKTESTLLTI
jgi:hypothetical protein